MLQVGCNLLQSQDMSAAESLGQKHPYDVGDDDNDDGGGKCPASSSSSAVALKSGEEEEEEDICWLCLDAQHESEQPLRRDCSCRGTGGFAHLPCIVDYGKQYSQQHLGDMNKFKEPWKKCPGW